MSDAAKQIFTLIPKIMAEVGAIEKSRQGQGISYKFRGIDDVYAALHAPLSKYGVFFAPKVLDIKRDDRQTKTGALMTVTILTMSFTFYGPDGSSFETITVGEAMDTSDKSANKAMSTALKYCLFQVFCIPTEEEKDTEYQHHTPMPKTQPTPIKTQRAPQHQGVSRPQISTPEGSKALTAKQLQLIQFIRDKYKVPADKYLKIVQDVAGVGSDTKIPFDKVSEVLGALDLCKSTNT